MLTELWKRIAEYSESFNKELENSKKNQSELKNTTTEKKNTLKGINSTLGDTEEHISDLEDRKWKSPNQNSKKKKDENILKDLWGNIMHTNFPL